MLIDEERKEERKLEGEADNGGAPDKSVAVDVEPASGIEIAEVRNEGDERKFSGP